MIQLNYYISYILNIQNENIDHDNIKQLLVIYHLLSIVHKYGELDMAKQPQLCHKEWHQMKGFLRVNN